MAKYKTARERFARFGLTLRKPRSRSAPQRHDMRHDAPENYTEVIHRLRLPLPPRC